MSHCGYFVTSLILVTSGLLSIGSSVENKICFNVSNQHICYFQPKGGLTWKQWMNASNICQENSATLPIIENQEVQKTFEEYLRNISLNTREIWLSGRQETLKKEWLWSNNTPFYQPDLILNGDQNPKTQAFIERISDSESPSNATLRYIAAYPSWGCCHICQYSASQCPADNSKIQNEHHGCLKVFDNQELNANEAKKNCNKSRGYLAIFDGDEFLTKVPKVYEQMQSVFTSYNFNCYYIGLHRNDTKSWFWMRSNNENSTMKGNYNNWIDKNNRGDGDCLFATANDRRWEASECNYQKRFVCQTIETPSTTATTKEDADSQSSKMNDQLLVSLIGAIAGTTALITAAFIIIVLLRRHRRKRKAEVSKSPKMSASYMKPKAVEKPDDNSPAVYEEIQLKTTEEEDNAQQTEATVYAEITAPPSDRNHNRSQQQGDNSQMSDTGVVYAAVEFTNNYN